MGIIRGRLGDKLPVRISKDILIDSIPTEKNYLIRIGHKIGSSGIFMHFLPFKADVNMLRFFVLLVRPVELLNIWMCSTVFESKLIYLIQISLNYGDSMIKIILVFWSWRNLRCLFKILPRFELFKCIINANLYDKEVIIKAEIYWVRNLKWQNASHCRFKTFPGLPRTWS